VNLAQAVRLHDSRSATVRGYHKNTIGIEERVSTLINHQSQ
jgi:hypothetical protein